MDKKKNSVSKKRPHKEHFCIFCKKEFKRLAEHCIRKHKNEDKVKDILNTRDKTEKLWKWKWLRQQGDHFFNTKLHEGEKKIVKAPTYYSVRKRYFDCPVCFARIRTISMAQHKNLCRKVYERDIFIDFERDIFEGFQEDTINKIRKSIYISSFLKELFELKENKQTVRTISNDIINFEEEICKLTKQNKPLTCFLTADHADDVLNTIQNMSGFTKSQKEKIISYPHKALRLCRMIQSFSKFLSTLYSKRNRDYDVLAITKFINIFESESQKYIRKQAQRSIKVKKFHTANRLPKGSDINKLIKKLKTETSQLILNLQTEKNPSSWRHLAENILCRLTIFNRRRGGAVEKMKISDYERTEVRLKTATEEAAFNLSAEEKEFLSKVRTVEILHKCDNVVPIYIDKELQTAMNILLEHRKYGDINERNEYFFAASKKSLNPISGVRVLEKYREMFPENVKPLITATNLRKHCATVVQMLDLNTQDREQWASHLGHSLQVHDYHYRKPEETHGTLNNVRILTAVHEGTIKYFKGKKVSEIPLAPEDHQKNTETNESPNVELPQNRQDLEKSLTQDDQTGIVEITNKRPSRVKKILCPYY